MVPIYDINIDTSNTKYRYIKLPAPGFPVYSVEWSWLRGDCIDELEFLPYYNVSVPQTVS